MSYLWYFLLLLAAFVVLAFYNATARRLLLQCITYPIGYMWVLGRLINSGSAERRKKRKFLSRPDPAVHAFAPRQFKEKSGQVIHQLHTFPWVWRPRFMILDETTLCLYDADTINKKGAVDIKGGSISSFKERENTFEVSVGKQSYYFQCASKLEKMEWMKIIKNNLIAAKGK